jgi:hypothetical protein
MSKHGMTSRHASQVKRGGHLREQIFSNQFTDSSMNEINTSVNYTGSSADCFISNPEYTYIINELGAVNGTTSVKGGSNFQFHLGRIPELIDVPSLEIIKVQSSKGKLETRFSSNITEKSQLEVLTSFGFWKKYLGKGELLAINVDSQWFFFLMRDVLELLTNPQKVRWRILATGRIKGDLLFKNGKSLAGITFEFRFEKNQCVLGAHGGGAGRKAFFPWLIDNLRYVQVKKMST